MSQKTVIKDTDKNTSAYYMKKLLVLFTSRAGVYYGKGIKDNSLEFSGQIDLHPIVNNDGVNIRYKAIDTDGEIVSEEHTIISLNNENILTLWTLNSDFHTMLMFKFKNHKRIQDVKDIFIFGFDSPDSNNFSREEITIKLWDNGDLSYNYFWGSPNGEFLSCVNLNLSKL
ncbi:MAG: hypothetical protein EHM58_16130 [Ignavibacteriae bacterium]|nr:MAG: hypothetical protein EHM58_16130 [Ignavibacteriota bacterium]